MADKTKTGIQLGADAFVSEREPVLVPEGKGHRTLYVRALGYMELNTVIGNARATGGSWMVQFLALAVEDDDGNRFTEDEVARLRKSVADPLFAAAMKINRLDEGDEGNG